MGLTYKNSGVNINLANKILSQNKRLISSTFNKNVYSEIGKFGGFYQINDDLILVSSIDGVGTKIKIAILANNCEVIGEDIVNHSVNDIMVHNAKPLFFLDYIAMEKLNPLIFRQIMKGIVKACRLNNVALIGGETAEMPGIYYKNMYDVAGCIVGIVEKDKIIDGRNISVGDALLAVASNGLHTNGFSLVNKLFFEIKNYKINDYIPELKSNLKNSLLRPHLSYKKLIDKINELKIKIKGMAHITGGGIIDNLSRIIPEKLCALINIERINILPIFKFIQKEGDISNFEMFRTFNMGVGLIIVAEKNEIDKIIKTGKKLNYIIYQIGEIVKKTSKNKVKLQGI